MSLALSAFTWATRRTEKDCEQEDDIWRRDEDEEVGNGILRCLDLPYMVHSYTGIMICGSHDTECW